MATITQQIPNYHGGISQQADEVKAPGQVNKLKNAIPDVTLGLVKRPGTQLLTTGVGDISGNITKIDNDKWFHYYRDSNEQYIGRINRSTGEIKMWDQTGTEKTVVYDSTDETAIKNYLRYPYADDSNPLPTEDELQVLTINDYTYLTNRNKTVTMDTAATATVNPARPSEAYIELKQVAYARQYSLNLFDNDETTSSTTATRIKLHSTDIDNWDSSCPNVGTEIFSVNSGNAFIQETKTKFIWKNLAVGEESAIHFLRHLGSGGEYYNIYYVPPLWIGTKAYKTGDYVRGNDTNTSKIYKRTGDNITGGDQPVHAADTTNGWTVHTDGVVVYAANDDSLVDGTTVQSTQLYHDKPCIRIERDNTNIATEDQAGINTFANGITGASHYTHLPFEVSDNKFYERINAEDRVADIEITWKNTGDYSDQIDKIIFTRDSATKMTIGGNNIAESDDSALKTPVGEFMLLEKGLETSDIVSGTGKSDLYFRLTTNGQSLPNHNASKYTCRYTTVIDLLNGGSGWQTNDKVQVKLKSGIYTINIEEAIDTKEQASLALVRPTPTSYDTKTTVTAESILGGIQNQILATNNFTDSEVTKVGNGLYVTLNKTVRTLASINDSGDLLFTITNHGFGTGRKVKYNFTGTILGSSPSLVNDSYYWVIRNDANSFWLATSHANAIAGTKIDYSADIVGGSTHTFTPEQTLGINTSENDLLNVFTNEIQDVADLPSQCKHGYKIKVRNSEEEADDYYLKFIGQEQTDGSFLDGKGIWEECAEPGRHVRLDYSTMPVGLVRTADGNFRVSQFDGTTYTVDSTDYTMPKWADCTVGSWNATTEEGTAPEPSFVNHKINKVVSFRNRLGILSDENVNLSRPGSFFDFWPVSAIAYAAGDNIDVSCSSTHPAILYDAMQVNTGLILFSENEQFMLTTDSDVLSPLTAKINSFSTYNYNKKLTPISLGTTIGFLDSASKYSRFFEATALEREGTPEVYEQSKIVSKLLPKNLTLIANSRENSIIFFAERGSRTIYGLRYLTGGNRRLQQAWFTWEMSSPIQHMALMDDELYLVLRDQVVHNWNGTASYKDTIQKLTLRLASDSPSIEDDNDTTITNDGVVYPIHLDNYIKIAATTLGSSGDNTSFTNTLNLRHLNVRVERSASDIIKVTRMNHGFKVGQRVYLKSSSFAGEFTIQTVDNTSVHHNFTGTDPNKPGVEITEENGTINLVMGAVAVPSGTTITNQGLYGKPIYLSSTQDTISGSDWDAVGDKYDVYVGYLFDMEAELPTIYPISSSNNNVKSDYTGGLVIHRTELNLGQNGIYEVELKRGMKKADGTRDKTTYSEAIGPLNSATPPVVATDYYSAAYVMPLEEEGQQVIPIYEKNKNLTLTFKSTSPSPATLYSMTWEGDYTNNNYERVT